MNNDDTYDKRFYGIYEGICTNNEDPDEAYKIKLKVPQVLGDTETNWASPCLPVTSNADHLDHLPHLASEVAALLTTHANHSVSVSGSTGAGGAPSHTHSFTASQTLTHTAHAGNTGELTHAHVTATDPLDNTDNEHTPHRKVPNVAQKVWVMFIAGDPNFPVWMGVSL